MSSCKYPFVLSSVAATACGLLVAGFSAFIGSAGAAYSGSNGMIAYTHRVPGNEGSWSIETVNPDGSGRNAVAGVAAPVWSPDGNRLLVSRLPAFGYADLYVRDVDGSNERKLTEGIAAWSPSWSPDGTKIAYKNASPSNSASGELWVMNADGSGKTQITTDGTGKGNLDWRMTPSGPRIAFIGFRLADGGWGLYTIAPDGSGRTRVGALPTKMAFQSVRSTLDWSPDGTKIALSAYQDSLSEHGVTQFPWDIWVVDVAAGTLTNMTRTTNWGGPHESDPVWSPDGTKIAFAAYSVTRDGSSPRFTPSTIYTMNAGGGGVTKISDPQNVDTGSYTADSNDSAPDWQPCSVGITKTCTSVASSEPAPPSPSQPQPQPNPQPAPRSNPQAPPTPRQQLQPAAAQRLFAASFIVPKRAIAGRLFVARLVVTAEDGGAIREGRATCRARVGRKSLRALAKGTRRGAAFCTWRVPANARGKRFSGSIRVAHGAASVSKSFTRRVR